MTTYSNQCDCWTPQTKQIKGGRSGNSPVYQNQISFCILLLTWKMTAIPILPVSDSSYLNHFPWNIQALKWWEFFLRINIKANFISKSDVSSHNLSIKSWHDYEVSIDELEITRAPSTLPQPLCTYIYCLPLILTAHRLTIQGGF